jgi:hypothetical protein
VPRDGNGLTEGAAHLPDEPADRSEGPRIAFAPGLLDHVVDPGSWIENERAAVSAFRKREAAVMEPLANGAYEQLYEELRKNELTGFFDPFVRRVYRPGLARHALREIALRLATRSVDRMPVEVGISLLGLCARHEDRPILLTLGRHEEFSHDVGVSASPPARSGSLSRWLRRS